MASDELRQGDLLQNVPFVVLKAQPNTDPNSGYAAVRVKTGLAVVVSQCCTTQQRKIAELAQVVRTRHLDPSHPVSVGLRSEWPAEAGPTFFDGLLVDPFPPYIDEYETDATGKVRLSHVSFLHRVTYTDELGWLQELRVARMTPESRRNLRLRLGAWYSRVEDTDKIALAESGTFSGFHDWPLSGQPPTI